MSVADVLPLHLNDYLHTLYYKWRCPACSHTVPFLPWEEGDVPLCLEARCDAGVKMVKVGRQSQNYIGTQTSAIRSFFVWCLFHKQYVGSNPIIVKVRVDERKTNAYPEEYLAAMDALITDKSADPQARIICYLSGFELLTVSELRFAQIPSLVRGEHHANSFSLITDNALLIADRPRPFSPEAGRRNDNTIEVDLNASPIVRELFEDYARWRDEVLGGARNRWLIVGEGRAHLDRPVGRDHVRRKLQRACLKAVGAALTPHIIKQSSAADIADNSAIGGAILTQFGYGSQRANAYNRAVVKRRTVYPKII